MEFTPSSILLSLFTGVVAGVASYVGAYVKVKGEIRAATEDLRQTIENLRATTRAVEIEKAQIAVESTLGADLRKAVYALATATQSLVHSMCWLSWDAHARNQVRADLSKMYDAEAHKLMPEMFAQMAVIRLLDGNLHARAQPYIAKLVELDVEYGNAIVASETDNTTGARLLADLHSMSFALVAEGEAVFGNEVVITRSIDS